MTEGNAREIADAFWQGLRWSLSDREIDRFLEALPDSVTGLSGASVWLKPVALTWSATYTRPRARWIEKLSWR